MSRPLNQAYGGEGRVPPAAHKHAHKPDLTKLYRWDARDLPVLEQEFRLSMKRPGKPWQPIDGIVDSVEWRYEQGDPVLHGSVTFSHGFDRKRFIVREGATLKLEVLWFGRWHEVFQMVMRHPQDSLSGNLSFDLDEPLYVLQESLDSFHYSRTKHGGHPHGWKCHEIARDIARRYHMRIGKIARGSRWIHALSDTDVSPLAELQRAYALEKAATGHRFVIRWAQGAFNVLPMRRNPLLYVLEPLIIDATLGYADLGDNFATALTSRVTFKGKGRKHHKETIQVYSRAAVNRYGWIHRNFNITNARSVAEAREKARRHLNKVEARQRTVTGLTHPGIALIRRGDALEMQAPGYWVGHNGIGFVSAGTWTLSGGDFQMSLDMTFDDPYVTTKIARKKKDKKTRASKRGK
jgi:hypothetical protein